LEVVHIDPFHKATRRNPDIPWITKPVHRAGRCGADSGGWFPPSLGKVQCSPAPPFPLLKVMFVKLIPNKQFRRIK
jgi:hypothetical protein